MITIIYLFLASHLNAESFGNSSALFLNENPSASCFASAGICSFSNDPDAAYLNSGLLGYFTDTAMSMSLWKAPDSIGNYGFINSVINLKQYGNLNLSFLGYSSGKETIYDLTGNESKLNLESDYLLSSGWGLPINDYLFFGFRMKRIKSVLAEIYSASTFSSDSGLIFKTLDDSYNISLNMENIYGKLTYISDSEKLPQNIKIEASTNRKVKDNILSLGIMFKKEREQKFIEKAAGLELSIKNLPIKIRMGFKNTVDSNYLTCGLGLSYSNIRLDYAIELPARMESRMQRIGLNIKFSQKTPKEKAEIYRSMELNEKADSINKDDLIYDKFKKKEKSENKEKNSQKTNIKNIKSNKNDKKNKEEKKLDNWLILPN
jgi:hypothetical protein